jgi:hypothetical protein
MQELIEKTYEDIIVKLLTVLYTEDISHPNDNLLILQNALQELKAQRDRNNLNYNLDISVKLK